MSDYYLNKFWNDVKDPSWPDVKTWEDFIKLEESIQQECFILHGLEQRLTEIENPEHWRIHSLCEMFQKDQFLFINVPKCGSSHYWNFFLDRLGWTRYFPDSINDLQDYVKFGLMMHPLDRYLKGLTQFIWILNLKDKINLDNFVTGCFIPDLHSIPYHLLFNDLIESIHWIPFSLFTDEQTKSCMNALFATYNSNIKIPVSHPTKNVSPPEKKILHEKISTHWRNRTELSRSTIERSRDFRQNLYIVYRYYAQDLKFYRELITNFKPDWSHIKGKISG